MKFHPKSAYYLSIPGISSMYEFIHGTTGSIPTASYGGLRRILPNYGDYGALLILSSHHGGNGAIATMITHLLLLVKVTRIDQMIALDKPEIIKKESL